MKLLLGMLPLLSFGESLRILSISVLASSLNISKTRASYISATLSRREETLRVELVEIRRQIREANDSFAAERK